MSRTVELDEQTFRVLELAAHVSGCTPGEMVRRLMAKVDLASSAPKVKPVQTDSSDEVPVHTDYDGHRTRGRFDPATSRIDITSSDFGLSGRSYKSPSAAASAVVATQKPHVSLNRNGWTFWVLDEPDGQLLQSIRRSSYRRQGT